MGYPWVKIMTERIIKEKKIPFTMIPIWSKSIKNKQVCERGEFNYYYNLQANKEWTLMNYDWTKIERTTSHLYNDINFIKVN